MRYGSMESEGVCSLHIFHGPGVVIPPDREMGGEELEAWLFHVASLPGYSMRMEHTPVTSALVEVALTLEDIIPKGSVEVVFGWTEDDGQKTVGAEVRNQWVRPIPKFSLLLAHQNDSPQRGVLADGAGDMKGVPFAETGGSISFMRQKGANHWLSPGETQRFAIDPRMLKSYQSRAVSLSLENLWVSLCTEGREFERLSGQQVIGVLLDGQ